MTEGVPLLSVDEQDEGRSGLRSRVCTVFAFVKTFKLILKLTKLQSGLSKRASSLETALQLVQRAVNEDKQRNYQEALSLYQHALVYFLESINCKSFFRD